MHHLRQNDRTKLRPEVKTSSVPSLFDAFSRYQTLLNNFQQILICQVPVEHLFLILKMLHGQFAFLRLSDDLTQKKVVRWRDRPTRGSVSVQGHHKLDQIDPPAVFHHLSPPVQDADPSYKSRCAYQARKAFSHLVPSLTTSTDGITSVFHLLQEL